METLLVVTGMTCMNCVRHVQQALARVDGVEQVSVELQAGTATVRHDGCASLQSMLAAVEDEGYEARAQDAAQP